MAHLVHIDKVVVLPDSSSPWAVRKMKETLLKQGQIEPLQVRAAGDYLAVFHEDAWGNEIVWAARELGWPTLLVVVTEKYEY